MYPPGISGDSDVVLTEQMYAYLGVLRSRLPGTVPLYVTSGVRTPSGQAAAMLTKLAAGGTKELYEVYNDSVINELLALPRDTTSWARYIEANASRVSRHLSGRAFDLRSYNLSSSQLQALQKAVTETGGRYLLEDVPAHLHIDTPTSGVTSAVDAATSAVSSASAAVSRVTSQATALAVDWRLWALWGAVGVMGVGGIIWWLSTMPRKRK